MKTIAFHSNQLCERGTEVALYDYAYFNETILGNRSFIISDKNSDLKALPKFSKKFNVYLYSKFGDVDGQLKQWNVDYFYSIKRGKNDGKISKVCKNIVHCVFDISNPHGDVYAAVSDWLSNGKVPVVPHMINLPNHDRTMRKELGISTDSFVLGRYGGYSDFDIDFVKETIKEILEIRDDVYFLFVNTKEFYVHNRVIYLPFILDLDEKVRFINSCDIMLHARRRGETFGISIGEFSSRNKPVLTWDGSDEKAHFDLLGNKVIAYTSKGDLLETLSWIDKDFIDDYNWNVVSDIYSPTNVMNIFNNIFLK